jgi:GH24 family phage-related lysozyme (muramidase)
MRTAFDIAREFLRDGERYVGHTYDDRDPKARPLVPGQACRGTPTIGYGHTGHHAVPGATMDREQAERVLVDDLAPCERTLHRTVKGEVLAQLDAYQQAALLSFIFNVGGPQWESSTLRRKLNAGDLDAFTTEAPRWTKTTVKQGGKAVKVTSDGLVARRAKEVLLWQTPATQEDAEEARVLPAEVGPPPAKPLSTSTTMQGVSIGAVGAVGGLLVQLLGGMQGLAVPVQLALVGTFAVTALGLLMAFRGRLRIRLDEGV